MIYRRIEDNVSRFNERVPDILILALDDWSPPVCGASVSLGSHDRQPSDSAL